MDPNDNNSTEISNVDAGIDLGAARAKLERAKAEVAEQQRAIVAEELRLAEAEHADLLAKCESAQIDFDEWNRKVEAQKHVYYKAVDRRNGADMRTDATMRNPPQPSWDGGRAYRRGERAEWQSEVSQCVAEQKAAGENLSVESAELQRLQGERRQAGDALQAISWMESPAQVRVLELRRKLATLTPRTIAAAPAWTPPEVAENAVLELTRDGLRTLPDAVGPKFR